LSFALGLRDQFFLTQLAIGDSVTGTTSYCKAKANKGLLTLMRPSKKAEATSGCCEVDSSCDCMIRGVATWRSAGREIAKVSMAFKCNLANRNNCKVSTSDSADEGELITAA